MYIAYVEEINYTMLCKKLISWYLGDVLHQESSRFISSLIANDVLRAAFTFDQLT